MSAAPTRAYVIEDRNGEALALVRDCQNPSQAIRALLERTGLRARVATAEDALDAIADGVVPFSADDPTADLRAARKAAQSMAEIAGEIRELDLTPAPAAEPAWPLDPRDSEGTPVAEPLDPFLVPRHGSEPTQAELEAADHAHDAAREARVFGGGR